MATSILFRKPFTLINTLGLSILFFYSWIKTGNQGAQDSNIIFWPGAYFLSLWVLSGIIPYYFNTTTHISQRHFFKKHLLTSLLFGLVHLLLTGALILLLERLFGLPEHYSLSTILTYFLDFWHYGIDGLLWYWAYIALLLLFHLHEQLLFQRQRNSAVQKELRAADLNFLRTELNPHFLYNAMNSIAMKVRLGENKLAVAMIASLNELLRAVLSMKSEKSIPLSEELKLLDKYLSIEKIRFGDQVAIEQLFSNDILSAKVPQLILQPLVENAFKHGIRENLNQQRISISGVREQDTLVLSVFNTSAPNYKVVTGNHTQGIGLHNIIMRLRRNYGTHFRFQSFHLEQGIAFKITIPFQTQ